MSKSKKGRPAGSPNKVTNEVKQAMLLAFEGMGGVQRLIDWATRNETNEMLWWTKMFIKLAPRPAVDVVPGPEALAPIRGAMTWKTPAWAEQARGKAGLRAGVAEVATAVVAALGSADGDRSPPPPCGRSPSPANAGEDRPDPLEHDTESGP